MHPTLARSNRFEDLLALDANDTPYAFDSIFRDDGWSARRLSKKKYKVLKNLDTRLRALLDEGERIRFLTFGSGVSFREQYFLGWAGHLLNYRAIVLTDRRILLVQIDWRERPRELHSQIRWPSIAGIKHTFLNTLKLRLNDGKQHIFQGVPRADRKLLEELSTKMSGVMKSDEGGMEQLCPHCFGVVAGRPARCPICGGGFKSARTAALRSLLFPGLGDFYLGHWKFAIWETLVAGFLWLGVLLPDPNYVATAGYYAFIAGFLFLFVHVPDALITRYVARKGHYPADGTVGARVAVRRKMEARAAERAGATTPVA